MLSPTKVLTAGHCVTDLPFGTTWVVAGRNNLSSSTGGFVARVSSTWTHQGFNLAALLTGAANVPIDDVSVLTLKDPLPAAYPPVTLSAQGDQTPYADGAEATIVGYGITASGASDSGILHKATVPIKSNATCSATLGAGYDAGRMTCAGNPSAGIDSCSGDSGGPLLVGGVQVGITDWGMWPCASTYGVYERLSYYANAVQADAARPGLANLDWSGDGHSDLLARKPNGDLFQWSGTGFAEDGRGGFAGVSWDGTGWQIYDRMVRVTDYNSDGRPSIVARDPSGQLFGYNTDGEGFFSGGRIQIGTGWNMYTDIVAVNNWNGDGRPNLLGRTASGGLYLYTSDGHGGWLNNGIGIQIGTGWDMFDTVLTPGPWMGDGKPTLVGRTPAGVLLLYRGDGAGGWLDTTGQQIGSGWNDFSIVASPGDWSGDNLTDLVGIRPDGVVKLYQSDGLGGWLGNGTGQQIGSGWNIYNAVF